MAGAMASIIGFWRTVVPSVVVLLVTQLLSFFINDTNVYFKDKTNENQYQPHTLTEAEAGMLVIRFGVIFCGIIIFIFLIVLHFLGYRRIVK